MTTNLKNLIFTLFFVMLAGIASVQAASKANSGEGFVENLSEKAVSVLAAKGMTPADRSHKFRVLLNQNFDVPYIGRFALGRYWRDASTKEQQEYLSLFEDTIVATYSERFAKYSGQKIVTLSTVKEVDSILVRSQMVNPDGSAPVLIDWRLRPSGSGFKIIDLIVEGVSMSSTQRSEYASVIERGGGSIEPLLQILRKKSASASGKAAASAQTD